MDDRSFPLSVILSFLTGHLLLKPEEGDHSDIVALMEFLENRQPGDSRSAAHQKTARAWLQAAFVERHPRLRGLDTSRLTEETCRDWLRKQQERLGIDSLKLTPFTRQEMETIYRKR